MSYEYIQVENKEHLTIITINRPKVMNAIHPPASAELDSAFAAFEDDPDAWVAILTGAGDRAFSAGNDLKYQTEHSQEEMLEMMAAIKGGFGGFTERFDLYKPVIAAVNGLALGGGFEMALAADIIVASENAMFGLPEPLVGLIANAGGTNRLPREIPYHLAMGMILTGKTISAAEALNLGIVNEVAAPQELMATAEKWASDILACAPLAVRAAKEAVVTSGARPLKDVVGKFFPGLETLIKSEDLKEGPLAFAQKRKPVWKGR